MGGFEDSGSGRRHHALGGVLRYTEAQTVAAQRLMPNAAPRHMREETFARVLASLERQVRRIPGPR